LPIFGAEARTVKCGASATSAGTLTTVIAQFASHLSIPMDRKRSREPADTNCAAIQLNLAWMEARGLFRDVTGGGAIQDVMHL
jgi:hypothetical protein